MEQSKHRAFRRADGVLGVGYIVKRCGTSQAAIAWPDRGAEHVNADDLARNGIEEIVTLSQLPHITPAETYDVAEPVIVNAEVIVEAGDKLKLDGADGATVLPAESEGEHLVAVEVKPDGQMVALEDSKPIQPVSEAQAIRNYLAEHGTAVTNKEVVAALKAQGINVSSSQVSAAKAEK